MVSTGSVKQSFAVGVALALLLAACTQAPDPSGARCVAVGNGLRPYVAVCPNTEAGEPRLATCPGPGQVIADCLDDHGERGVGPHLMCNGDEPVTCAPATGRLVP